MNVSVLVAWRPDGAARTASWKWLQKRWRALYPDWELVSGDAPGEWNRGQVANELVRRSTGDVLVMADADVWVPGLRTAVKEALKRPWVVPHGDIRRLTQPMTAEILAESPKHDLWPGTQLSRTAYRAWPGGGCLVIRRENWVGADETFWEGGCWDESLGLVLDALAGPHHKLSAPLWHLWHPPAMRARSNPQQHGQNVARILAYKSVKARPEAVRALVAGEPTNEVIARYAPNARRAVDATRRLNTQVWRR